MGNELQNGRSRAEHKSRSMQQQQFGSVQVQQAAKQQQDQQPRLVQQQNQGSLLLNTAVGEQAILDKQALINKQMQMQKQKQKQTGTELVKPQQVQPKQQHAQPKQQQKPQQHQEVKPKQQKSHANPAGKPNQPAKVVKSVSNVPFKICPIEYISNMAEDATVDLMGAIDNVSKISIVKKKNKIDVVKRDVTIVDTSLHAINVTIWGEKADDFRGNKGDILVVSGAKVGTWGGKSVSASGALFVNSKIPSTVDWNKLKVWYSTRTNRNFIHLTKFQAESESWKYLSQLNDIEQMRKIAPNSASHCKAVIMSIGKNPVYKCCPLDGCGKKLVPTQSDDMECQKCNKTFSRAKYRYRVDVQIKDESGSCWVTLWDDKAEFLFGIKPEKLTKKIHEKKAYDQLVERLILKKFSFKLQSKIDKYNNEDKITHTVVSLTPAET